MRKTAKQELRLLRGHARVSLCSSWDMAKALDSSTQVLNHSCASGPRTPCLCLEKDKMTSSFPAVWTVEAEEVWFSLGLESPKGSEVERAEGKGALSVCVWGRRTLPRLPTC